MPLNSINPNDFYQQNNQQGMNMGTANNAMQQFNQPMDDSNMMKPPQTAIPGPNPVDQDALNTNQLNKLTKTTEEGDKAIAAAAKSSGGGGGIGGILGSVGSIIGGLFSEGGMVGGYAEGGAVEPSNDAMAMGYMVGALHQQKYGGTPDTLQDAAAEIKQMMQSQGNQQGMNMSNQPNPAQDMFNQPIPDKMADGGLSALNGPNGQLIEALGLSGQPKSQQPQMPQQGGFAQPPDSNASPMPSQPQQGMMNNPAMGVPGQPLTASQQAPMAPQSNPAMRGFADGGPNMGMPPGQEQPPLSPGQAFQGDGEVKGPGGPTDDMIPAKLSNGEFVMSQPATAFFGVDKLIKMNEQGKQGFMQAKQQVDQNQPQQGGGAPPMEAPPSAGPGMIMPPPPMPQEGMAKGGAAVMRSKGSGYCGI